MPDYLSCGSCPQDFELSDITQFIEHKRWNCSTASRETTQFAINLLECVKCFRKFNTPWPLLIHIQLDHHLNVVRNLVLPRQQPPPLIHQQQTSHNELDMEAEHRSVTTQTRTTSLQRSRCYPICCQKSEPLESNEDDSSCLPCPCAEAAKPPCCRPVHPTEAAPRTSASCCQQQPGGSPAKKPKAESCCPCPPKAEMNTRDCQTDFEYFDFDMDLLLSDDQLAITPAPVVTSSETQAQEQVPNYPPIIPGVTEVQSQSVETQQHPMPLNNSMWPVDNMSMLPLLNAGGSTTAGQTFFPSPPEPQYQSSSLFSNMLSTPSVADVAGSTSLLSPESPSQLLRSPSRKTLREFRFMCQQCGKPFRQNVHLRKHVMAQHTNQKPHKCPHCGYTTVEKSHLTVHIRTHTGEKPYRCRNCTYSSAQNCTLKSHYLRRHPGSSVVCDVCGDGYITEQEKNNHQKTCREMATSTVMDLDTP